MIENINLTDFIGKSIDELIDVIALEIGQYTTDIGMEGYYELPYNGFIIYGECTKKDIIKTIEIC